MAVTASNPANFGHQPDPCPRCGKRTVNAVTPPAEWASRADVPQGVIYTCRSCGWSEHKSDSGWPWP
jgi:predicted RNA-binding Zn-ribbon protein involved in translation (DUF1610 family)